MEPYKFERTWDFRIQNYILKLRQLPKWAWTLIHSSVNYKKINLFTWQVMYNILRLTLKSWKKLEDAYMFYDSLSDYFLNESA